METQKKRIRKRAQVEEASCVACGCCVKVCPMDAIHVVLGTMAKVDDNKCIGCGKCAKECPASIIIIREAAL